MTLNMTLALLRSRDMSPGSRRITIVVDPNAPGLYEAILDWIEKRLQGRWLYNNVVAKKLPQSALQERERSMVEAGYTIVEVSEAGLEEFDVYAVPQDLKIDMEIIAEEPQEIQDPVEVA